MSARTESRGISCNATVMTNACNLQAQDASRFFKYLSLPDDYEPGPVSAPLDFLKLHLRQLPKHLAIYFASSVPARTRTALPLVRNRRLNYVQSPSGADALGWKNGRAGWPLLWEQSGTTPDDDLRPGQLSGLEERAWANRHFMHGRGGELNRLGALLGEYEAEREAERARQLRRDDAVRQSMMPQLAEEEEESDEEEEDDDPPAGQEQPQTVDEHRLEFERRLRERFIYGLLDGFEYDDVDWDDKWDTIGDRDDEDRWFDEDDEDDTPMEIDRSTSPDY